MPPKAPPKPPPRVGNFAFGLLGFLDGFNGFFALSGAGGAFFFFAISILGPDLVNPPCHMVTEDRDTNHHSRRISQEDHRNQELRIHLNENVGWPLVLTQVELAIHACEPDRISAGSKGSNPSAREKQISLRLIRSTVDRDRVQLPFEINDRIQCRGFGRQVSRTQLLAAQDRQ